MLINVHMPSSASPGDKVCMCGDLICELPRCATMGCTPATWSSAACRRGNMVWDLFLHMGLQVARYAEDDGEVRGATHYVKEDGRRYD